MKLKSIYAQSYVSLMHSLSNTKTWTNEFCHNKVSIPDKINSRNQISSQNNYFIISENQISISFELSG
jgi:hypothetical protein